MGDKEVLPRSQRSCVFIVYIGSTLRVGPPPMGDVMALTGPSKPSRFCVVAWAGGVINVCHPRLFSPLRQEGLRFADKQGSILL